MARPLKEFPKATRRSKYPWAEWLNGKPWMLRRGEDYETSSESMRAIASKAAIAAGKRVRTQITTDQDGNEALVIQAYTE
jgi:hypothetical protein